MKLVAHYLLAMADFASHKTSETLLGIETEIVQTYRIAPISSYKTSETLLGIETLRLSDC